MSTNRIDKIIDNYYFLKCLLHAPLLECDEIDIPSDDCIHEQLNALDSKCFACCLSCSIKYHVIS